MEWLTVTEVSKRMDVSDRTIRRYIKAHKVYIDTRDLPGRSLEVHEDSIETLQLIRRMYTKGWDRERVDRYLAETKPMIIRVENDEKSDLPEIPGEKFSAFQMLKEMAERQKRIEENQRLILEQMSRQQQEYRQGLDQIAVTLNRDKHRKKRGIWGWFGK